jgi:hypothetical protein
VYSEWLNKEQPTKNTTIVTADIPNDTDKIINVYMYNTQQLGNIIIVQSQDPCPIWKLCTQNRKRWAQGRASLWPLAETSTHIQRSIPRIKPKSVPPHTKHPHTCTCFGTSHTPTKMQVNTNAYKRKHRVGYAVRTLETFAHGQNGAWRHFATTFDKDFATFGTLTRLSELDTYCIGGVDDL